MTKTINIDLWFWHFDASPADLARWSGMLSADEKARVERFMFEADKRRFTVCRSRLRRILGWYAATPPRAVTFATTGRNKPVLAGSNPDNLQFNLTHTGDMACLALAYGEPVGIDLERVREINDDFIAHTLNPAEQSDVMQLDAQAREAAFFRIWTAKEAYLKALGTGLFQSLKSFDVKVPPLPNVGDFHPAVLTRIDDHAERRRNWRLYAFRASDEHYGALAVAPPAGTEVIIRTRQLDT